MLDKSLKLYIGLKKIGDVIFGVSDDLMFPIQKVLCGMAFVVAVFFSVYAMSLNSWSWLVFFVPAGFWFIYVSFRCMPVLFRWMERCEDKLAEDGGEN